MAENALLRHQRAVLQRSVKRPHCTPADRALIVLLAGRARAWQSALLIVHPDTLLRWHRELFRRYWLYRLLRSSARLAAMSGGAGGATRAVESGAAA